MFLREKPLSYEEAIRILLEGTCGINKNKIEKETGAQRAYIVQFMNGGKLSSAWHDRELIEKLGMFIWKKMNSHLLLSEEDYD